MIAARKGIVYRSSWPGNVMNQSLQKLLRLANNPVDGTLSFTRKLDIAYTLVSVFSLSLELVLIPLIFVQKSQPFSINWKRKLADKFNLHTNFFFLHFYVNETQEDSALVYFVDQNFYKWLFKTSTFLQLCLLTQACEVCVNSKEDCANFQGINVPY